jgi:hypothetical protein
MILSHEHKFIFVKGKKVGGTSVEIALSQICGQNDIITPITAVDEYHRLGTAGAPRNYAQPKFPACLRRLRESAYIRNLRTGSRSALNSVRPPPSRFWNHIELARILELEPAAATYEVVCVERSPYAKVTSLANWLYNSEAYYRGSALPRSQKVIADLVDRLIADGAMTRVLNIGRYRDREGVVRVVPWRTDHLARDLSAFLKSRGLKPIPLVYAKQGLRSNAARAAVNLRADQISAINDVFAEEFEVFGWPKLKPRNR